MKYTTKARSRYFGLIPCHPDHGLHMRVIINPHPTPRSNLVTGSITVISRLELWNIIDSGDQTCKEKTLFLIKIELGTSLLKNKLSCFLIKKKKLTRPKK